MKVVLTHSLKTGEVKRYMAPSMSQSARHLRETHGREYDRCEGRMVEGGLPMVWQRAESAR